MVLALLTLVAVAVLGAPWWAAVGAGAIVLALRLAGRGRRRRQRARQRERLRVQASRRREQRRAGRRQAVLERTGLDIDLVARAAQDTARDTARAAQDSVRAVGTRITAHLERRYALPAEPGPEPLLDLDTDFGSLRSQARTTEALRLNDELGRVHRA